MNVHRVILSMAVVMLATALVCGTAFSQSSGRVGRIGKILEEAGCPLTDDQKEDIEALDSSPESRRRMMEILDDTQREALQKNWRGRGDESRRPRGRRGDRDMAAGFLRYVDAMLEEAGCPLSEEQREEIRALTGSGARDGMMDILTDQQKTVVEKARQEQEARMTRARVAGMKYIVDAMNEAGLPLSEDQLRRIRELPGGRESFRGMMEVFDDKQSEALRESGAMTLMFIGPTLEEAGCPLTDEQVNQIKASPPGRGEESRGRMMEVLTDKQREALDSMRGGGRR